MAAVYDYSVPMTLSTPYGDLPINQLTTVGGNPLGYFMLDHDGCDSGANLRVSRDDIPQSSGEINHLHYRSGYEMRLKMQFWETVEADGAAHGQPAWRDTLQQMIDMLQLHLNSLVDDDPLRPLYVVGDPFGKTRLTWTPFGSPARLLDRTRLLERLVLTDDGVQTAATFALMSQLPYAFTAPSDLHGSWASITGLADNTPVAINNLGTARMYPVVQIQGPTSFFELKNLSYTDVNGNPAMVRYDSSLPGGFAVPAGGYVELDFWKNTAYINGNGANAKPNIWVDVSDFWPLTPGANIIEVSGGHGQVMWASAWA